METKQYTEYVRSRVAIIGRPNVGKSTLFNALIRKRVAITHEMTGVTHEGVTYSYEYDDIHFELKDTGGITDEGTFASLIRDRSLHALEQCDIVLFVVAVGELTAEDEEIAKILRKSKKTVIVVVNKVDNENRDWDSSEMYTLGFDDLVPISALHRKNFILLLDKMVHLVKTLLLSQTHIKDEDTTDKKNTPIKLLIVGKPNTGKSSFVNCITGSSCMVSDIPGTTRDLAQELFEYDNQKYMLIDSAGIRKKSRVHEDVEYYSVHRAIDFIGQTDIVILLVDVAEGFSEQDKKITSLAIRRGKGFIIALNKWDLVRVEKNRLEAEKDRLDFLFPQIIKYVPLLPVSAQTGYGVDNIIKTSLKLYHQLYTRISTPILNRAIQKWVEEKVPPLIRGKRGKIKYISQTGVCPPTFKVRVNNPKLFPEFYTLYIKNRIRREFTFSNIAFHVHFIASAGA